MGHKFIQYSLKQVKEESGVYDCTNVVKSPEDADNILRTVLELHSEAVEKFGILTLNTKHVVTGIHILSVGSLDAAIVHPREIFKAALMSNSSGIICFHNHPSGDPNPSDEDIQTTKRIVEAGKLLGIDVVDHIIVGDDGQYVSLKSRGSM